MTSELETFLKEQGYEYIREISGHGVCAVFRFMFTYGLVLGIDSEGYKGRYCYGSKVEALYALDNWSGELDPPGNWIKYKCDGGERSRL